MTLRNVPCDAFPIAKLPEFVPLADIIVCATTAARPLFDGALVKKGAFVSAVGAYQPHTRELDSALIASASVFVDTEAGCFAEAGDLLIPVAEGCFQLSSVKGEIGKVIN